LPQPVSHAATVVVLHAPVVQAATPCAREHTLPQRPQLRASVGRVTQALVQSVAPAGQVITHAPPMHAVMPAQARPQAPQFEAALRVSTSQPLVGSPSQSAKPVAHTGTQAPATQAFAVVEALVAHTRPQAPQLEAELRVSTSQPFEGSPSQSAKPVAHTGTQAAATQGLAEVPALVAQAAPQAPQWAADDCVSTHAPLHRESPAAHAHAPIAQV
jgi:hypothetical protein